MSISKFRQRKAAKKMAAEMQAASAVQTDQASKQAAAQALDSAGDVLKRAAVCVLNGASDDTNAAMVHAALELVSIAGIRMEPGAELAAVDPEPTDKAAGEPD